MSSHHHHHHHFDHPHDIISTVSLYGGSRGRKGGRLVKGLLPPQQNFFPRVEMDRRKQIGQDRLQEKLAAAKQKTTLL